MELFLNVSSGIFTKVFTVYKKKNNTYEELLLELVDIWIRTITLTAKIWQTITGISVIFIIKNSVPQLQTYFATATFSGFGLSLPMAAIFWVWAFSCALGLRHFLIYWGSQLQSYHRGMRVPVSSSRFQPDEDGSHFFISLFIECIQ